jgi:hypothetical protein
MTGTTMKLAGALFAGTLAGVAALTTLTSSPSPQLSPASDSTSATPSVVESAAPCPAGTVERDDSCVRTVAVPVAAPRADDSDAAEPSEAPKASDSSRPAAVAHSPEPAETPESDVSEAGNDSEHESDASEVEHQDEHADSDGAEHESGD